MLALLTKSNMSVEKNIKPYKLKNKMKQQTIQRPKPAFIKIIAKLETSTHDGDCSDEECTYKSSIIVQHCKIPDKYKKLPIYTELGIFDEEWEKYLPKPEFDKYQSHQCDLNKKCIEADLGVHDYRFTIKSVHIVGENKKF